MIERMDATRLPLRPALRAAKHFRIETEWIAGCIGNEAADVLFQTARERGLAALDPSRRSGHLARVTGEIAESVATIFLDNLGYSLFWQLVTSGAHGVDLLLLASDEAVLALEVKGTLRAGAIPRLTPSLRRQMSREWLNGPDNPAMAEWEFEADYLSRVAVVDLATAQVRLAVSSDFETYLPITDVAQLAALRALDEPSEVNCARRSIRKC